MKNEPHSWLVWGLCFMYGNHDDQQVYDDGDHFGLNASNRN